MTFSFEESSNADTGEMDLLEPQDVIVSLDDGTVTEEFYAEAEVGEEQPEEHEELVDTIELAEFKLDEPPVVQLSFAERVALLTEAMVDASVLMLPEPENMTVVDYYDMAHGAQGYLGKLYLNADTGEEYKLVKMDGSTVFLGTPL